MSRSIKAGDIAVVVRPGYHGMHRMGLIFKVKKIKTAALPCRICNASHGVERIALWLEKSESPNGRRRWIRCSRLKRILPPEELGREERGTEIEAMTRKGEHHEQDS